MAPQQTEGHAGAVVKSKIRATDSNISLEPKELGYTSGFRVYPTYREIAKWDILLGKARADGVGGEAWRIHNKLYNLQDFAEKHPGGAWWIWYTRGQDITELFESSHVTDAPEKMLEKYYVGEATKPRNSPYTFHENGFYRTLKRKVVKHLNENGGAGPTRMTHLVMDSIVLVFLIVASLAGYSGSIFLAGFAGFLNHMIPACAHNYFHQRNSWRMYYVGLAQALTVEEYRTFHVLSHHPFPNTVYDAEVFGLEPFVRMLTEKSKSWQHRWLSPVAVALIALFGSTPMILIKTSARIGWGTCFSTPEHLATFAIWPLLLLCSGGNFYTATLFWFIICHVSSCCTLLLALASTHHHPENFHDGDTPRTDSDWGLFQLDATNDRPEYIGNFVLTSLLFGDHVLHHLFPTVDVSRLHQLYPLLFETCHQFNIPHRLYGQLEMLYHQFCQASNTNTRTLGPERHQFKDYSHTHYKPKNV